MDLANHPNRGRIVRVPAEHQRAMRKLVHLVNGFLMDSAGEIIEGTDYIVPASPLITMIGPLAGTEFFIPDATHEDLSTILGSQGFEDEAELRTWLWRELYPEHHSGESSEVETIDGGWFEIRQISKTGEIAEPVRA
jgi:hypothetical protein